MVTGMERPRTCSCPWELSFTVLNSLPANSIDSRKVLLTAFPWGCISVCWGGVSFPNLSFLSYHWTLVWTLPICLSVSDFGQEPCLSLLLGPSTWSACLDGRQAGQVASCESYWFHKCCVPPLPGALLAPHQLSERMWVRWPCNDRLYMLLKAGWKQGLAEVRHWGVFLWGWDLEVSYLSPPRLSSS